jgi:enoyl-CoA hydratase
MSFQDIEYSIAEQIATITLNRPRVLNVFSTNLKNEVRAAFSAAAADPEVRVIVVRGAGRAFSAGYDISEGEYSHERAVPSIQPRLQDDLEFTLVPFDHPKPVIASIHGYCLAGALEFVLMCDLRFAADDAVFGVVETRFADGVVTLMHPWIIGAARAKDLIFSGRQIDAQEALTMGLVNRLFPREALQEETLSYARILTKVAPEALVWNKRALNQMLEIMGLRAALASGLAACVQLDSTETEIGREFEERTRRDGLTAAIRWRDAQFPDTR